MSITIRPLQDGELRAWMAAVETAFGEESRDDAFAAFDHFHDAVGELNPASLNPHDDQIIRSPIQLDNFDRHPLQRPLDRSGIEHGRIFGSHRSTIWLRLRAI